MSEGCPDNERLERLSRENHKIQSASLLESTQNMSHFFARNKDNYYSHNLMFHVFILSKKHHFDYISPADWKGVKVIHL